MGNVGPATSVKIVPSVRLALVACVRCVPLQNIRLMLEQSSVRIVHLVRRRLRLDTLPSRIVWIVSNLGSHWPQSFWTGTVPIARPGNSSTAINVQIVHPGNIELLLRPIVRRATLADLVTAHRRARNVQLDFTILRGDYRNVNNVSRRAGMQMRARSVRQDIEKRALRVSRAIRELFQ